MNVLMVMDGSVQNSDSCVQRSMRIDKSWEIAIFFFKTQRASPNKSVVEMATHLR